MMLGDDSQRRMLILDFDGVLADTEPIHFECWNRAFDELLGITISGDHRQLVGLTQTEIYALWANSPAGNGIALTQEMQADLLKRKTDLFFQLAAGKLQPMSGSIDLIRRAQSDGWYIAIASRAKRLRLHRTLDLMGMPALFDLVLGGEELIDSETDHKVHARAARMLGIDPAECVVIEDSPSGVADAVACGIGRVIGFAHTMDSAVLEAAGAHEIVEDLSEIELEE